MESWVSDSGVTRGFAGPGAREAESCWGYGLPGDAGSGTLLQPQPEMRAKKEARLVPGQVDVMQISDTIGDIAEYRSFC